MPPAADLLARLLADPPNIHALTGEAEGAALGAWPTEPGCYRLLASACPPGSRTLETGIGLSTALLAGLGARHTCVAFVAQEVDRLLDYCAGHALPTDQVEFLVGFSEDVLPGLDPGPLDAFLIDGGHGFPTPMLDWFYGARHLRDGGLLLVDDLQLPAVAMLDRFLGRDQRWVEVDRTAKWAGWRRNGLWPWHEDHWQQPFLAVPPRRRRIFPPARRTPVG
jgi:Methyltransferase domain